MGLNGLCGGVNYSVGMLGAGEEGMRLLSNKKRQNSGTLPNLNLTNLKTNSSL